MTPAQLSRATIYDINALQAISTSTFRETFAWGNSSENMEGYIHNNLTKETLLTELNDPQARFDLAKIQSAVAGYLKVVLEPQQIELQRIYVLKAYQGHGIGAALLNKAIALAHENNLPSIWLGVWERNEQAQQFYHHWGFYEAGEHTFQLGDDTQRDIIMRLDI